LVDLTAPLRPFSVMVKPVGSTCNLRCSYCYYLSKPRLGPARMSDEVLELFIRDYIASSTGPVVGFVWHGGEPTLAGLDFYRRVVELQKRHAPAGWQCWNNLQSNGLLLGDEWCAFLAENRFDVGLSVDGTAWLHDRFRPDTQGEPSYHQAVAAIERLKAHGIRPDLLCTVTAATAEEPLTVYQHLRSFDTGWIQFIPIVARIRGEITQDSVGPDQYGQFLCTIFDQWITRDLGRLDVQLFAETTRVLAGGEAGLCWMAPTCGRAVVVEADGGVYSCDHYVTARHRLGCLCGGDPGETRDSTTTVLRALVDSAAQDRFGQDKQTGLPDKCLACPHLALCNGGCPKDRLDDGLNYLCAGLAKFFAHATPKLTRLIEASRAGHTPAAIMAEFRAAGG